MIQKITLAIFLAFFAGNVFADDIVAPSQTDAANVPAQVLAAQNPELITEILHEESKTSKYKINIHYPQIKKDSEFYASSFNANIKKLVTQIAENFLKTLQELNPTEQNNADTDQSSTLNIRFMANTINQHLIGVRFTVDSYIQGTPYPNVNYQAFNFDLKANKKVNLKDLFQENTAYLKFISDFCAQKLVQKTQMDELHIRQYFLNFDIWNLQTAGILFTFDDFPHVLGPQQVFVSYGLLKPYLTPEFNKDVPEVVSLTRY